MMAPGDREFTKCVSNVITWSFSSVVRSANTALACTSLYYATSCQISVTLQLAIISLRAAGHYLFSELEGTGSLFTRHGLFVICLLKVEEDCLHTYFASAGGSLAAEVEVPLL